MVAVEVADEYPHLAVNPCSGLKKLTLGSLSAIEEQEFGPSSD